MKEGDHLEGRVQKKNKRRNLAYINDTKRRVAAWHWKQTALTTALLLLLFLFLGFIRYNKNEMTTPILLGDPIKRQ